jgi:hypothetical protein
MIDVLRNSVRARAPEGATSYSRLQRCSTARVRCGGRCCMRPRPADGGDRKQNAVEMANKQRPRMLPHGIRIKAERMKPRGHMIGVKRWNYQMVERAR